MNAENPQIKIAQGILEGLITITDDCKTYYSFQGIPYATPPIGCLRFQNPLPPQPWDGVLQAKKEGSSCTQFNLLNGEFGGSEDCLYLNVYTPKLPKDSARVKLPVMMWIHGGGFQTGSGDTIIYGPDWFMEQDVVLVTINYRCGVMGFLCLNLPEAPGNVGLKDQIAALKWINKNINAFGGDPNNVTIFGQSAGGASVNYLMLSDSTRGLFHRAIAMSGSALNPWAHQLNPEENAYKLCKALGFNPFDNNRMALQFLRLVPADKLYDIIGKPPKTTVTQEDSKPLREFIFLPTIEQQFCKQDALLTESALKRMELGKFHNVPFMAGYTNKEGLYVMRDAVNEPALFGLRAVDFRRYIPRELSANAIKNHEEIAMKIKDFYYGDRPVDETNLDNFVDIKGDTWFNRGVDTMVRLIAKSSKEHVYYYEFTFDEFGVTKHVNHDMESQGATHAEDLGYLFKHKLVDLPRDIPKIEKTRQTLLKLYTNFARTGDPTPDGSLSVIWKRVTEHNLYYLEIGEVLKLLKNPKKESMNFWIALIKEYQQIDYCSS